MATHAAARRPVTSYSRGFRTWSAVLAVVLLLGLYSFYVQTVEGHYLSGLNDLLPWGLYISGFVFFVGASAGATLIGLLIHAFGRTDYAPLGTRAILIGLLSLMAAVLFITADVGSIPRMMGLPWLYRNFTSMFTYTSLTYYFFGALLLAELYFTIKINQGRATPRDRQWAKWLAIAAVPFALVVVHAPHGALFAVVKAREFWNNPLLPPHFAVVALVTGTAIMILIATLTSFFSRRELVSSSTLSHMGMLLAFFIGAAAFLDFFDFLVFSYSDEPAGNMAWYYLSAANLPFSVLHVGGYIVALAILLLRRGNPTTWVPIAAAVAIVAVAAYRYNLTVVGVSVPLFPFLPAQSYVPSWTEISVAAGIIALVLLAYSVLTRVIPVEEKGAA